jgi:hypothetical protein
MYFPWGDGCDDNDPDFLSDAREYEMDVRADEWLRRQEELDRLEEEEERRLDREEARRRVAEGRVEDPDLGPGDLELLERLADERAQCHGRPEDADEPLLVWATPPGPYFTPQLKEEWLDNLRRQHGEEWLRQNWARLEEEWAYLQTL